MRGALDAQMIFSWAVLVLTSVRMRSRQRGTITSVPKRLPTVLGALPAHPVPRQEVGEVSAVRQLAGCEQRDSHRLTNIRLCPLRPTGLAVVNPDVRPGKRMLASSAALPP